MIMLYISAACSKKNKRHISLRIPQKYIRNCNGQRIFTHSLPVAIFVYLFFLFWQVIYPFVFYNDSVNRKEMNFHEKQIPQLY